MTTEDVLAVTKNPNDRRPTRAGTIVWLLGVVVAAVLIGGLVSTIINSREDVATLTTRVDVSAAALDAAEDDITTLSGQLESLGVEPAIDDDQVTEGIDGRDGRDGRDGTDGADGAPGPPGPAGADGTNGTDGVNGVDGVNGLDGLPGPQGPPGQSVMGPQGPTGLTGPAGVVEPFTFTAGGITFLCTPVLGVSPTECTQVAA